MFATYLTCVPPVDRVVESFTLGFRLGFSHRGTKLFFSIKRICLKGTNKFLSLHSIYYVLCRAPSLCIWHFSLHTKSIKCNINATATSLFLLYNKHILSEALKINANFKMELHNKVDILREFLEEAGYKCNKQLNTPHPPLPGLMSDLYKTILQLASLIRCFSTGCTNTAFP